MTEAERLQKREEMARRRKRQNEQRLQDEQVSVALDLRVKGWTGGSVHGCRREVADWSYEELAGHGATYAAVLGKTGFVASGLLKYARPGATLDMTSRPVDWRLVFCTAMSVLASGYLFVQSEGCLAAACLGCVPMPLGAPLASTGSQTQLLRCMYL